MKPEYLSDFDEENELNLENELDLNWTEEDDDDLQSGLSDDDINDLI